MLRASPLKGLAVLTLSDAARVGQVDDVLFDTEMRHVLGFRVGTGRVKPTEAIARADVAAVGREAVTVADPATLNQEARLPALAQVQALGQATDTKVVSEGGDLLGKIADVELDDDVRVVTGYVLASPVWDRLRRQEPIISAQRIVRLGSDGIMVVPQEVAESLRPKT